MSKMPADPGEPFDLEHIRRLAALMNEQQLSEVTLVRGDLRLRLRRGAMGVFSPAPLAAPTGAAPSAPAAAKADDSKLHVIKSPMVGTFYTASSPDAPAFVRVGDHVGPETTVCIIEAMKVFNEIPAEVSGKIVAVLVENGEPVEFGQALFKVDSGH